MRKVADPLQPELAIGAISAGKVAVWRNGQATASDSRSTRNPDAGGGDTLYAQLKSLLVFDLEIVSTLL